MADTGLTFTERINPLDYRLLYDAENDNLGVIDCEDGIPFGLSCVSGVPCWEQRAFEEGLLLQRGSGPALPHHKVKAILADPAWMFVTYEGSGTPHRTEEDHYKVTALDEMKMLPVAGVADEDCALFMWVIGSHLKQAVELGESWGFEYKTDVFTWVKTGKHDDTVRPIGMGYWSRKQTETCLLFTKGSPPRLEASVRQLFETDDHLIFAPKTEHSVKPDEQYDRVERLVSGPYLEMFARRSRDGWAAWGDEAPGMENALWRLERSISEMISAVEKRL
mgnify:CR=1 FL=1